MNEPEEIIREVKLKLDEVQHACLEWKGSAISMAPALKVALAALVRVQWTLQWASVVQRNGNLIHGCPWCRASVELRPGEDQTEHAPDCERQIAIKVIKEAIGRI